MRNANRSVLLQMSQEGSLSVTVIAFNSIIKSVFFLSALFSEMPLIHIYSKFNHLGVFFSLKLTMKTRQHNITSFMNHDNQNVSIFYFRTLQSDRWLESFFCIQYGKILEVYWYNRLLFQWSVF